MILDKEIKIKRKITVGDILVLIMLFIISISCIYDAFDEGIDKNIGLLIMGSVFAMIFLLIFSYIILGRPYYRITSEGVYAKLPKGFTYGKEEFYSWDKILSEINQNKDVTEDGLTELNDEFIENYINSLRQKMSNIDYYLINGIPF